MKNIYFHIKKTNSNNKWDDRKIIEDNTIDIMVRDNFSEEQYLELLQIEERINKELEEIEEQLSERRKWRFLKCFTSKKQDQD